jgi:hypothetical protein
MELLVIGIVLAVFELAAVRWGVDSRDATRESHLDRPLPWR